MGNLIPREKDANRSAPRMSWEIAFCVCANVHDFPRIEKFRRKDSCCSLPLLIMGNKTHLKNCRASNVASATPNR